MCILAIAVVYDSYMPSTHAAVMNGFENASDDVLKSVMQNTWAFL